MALTFTSVRNLDSIGNLRCSVVDVALDNLYTAGGYVLTPQQLGLPNGVNYGDVSVKTVLAAGPGGGFLDCSNPTAPKLKLNNATAEMTANATLTSAIVEVTAYGY